MINHLSTHNSWTHVSYSGASRLGMAHIAAHFLGLCAAIRYIDGKSVPLDAPLALFMERIAAHFGRFSTNEPTIEPTKTQGIDERTQQSNERTQDSANEPEVRLVAPMAQKPVPLLRSGRPGGRGGAVTVVGLEPEKGDSAERPHPGLTRRAVSAIIPILVPDAAARARPGSRSRP
jgi:hypothetical protein